MRRVNYYLTADQVERIDGISLRTGMDRSTVIRAAIDAYLAKDERPRREKP
jgi:metal-responsive CopG/Arc/MetJ family transcriptional regulator